VLGSFFSIGGLFCAIGSYMAKLPMWGWAIFSGILSVVLGIIVLWQMPITSLWFIGFAVGFDLILDGIAVCAFAHAIHHLPLATVFQGA
jgi:uncharacterized membrane protein HdeD (DUF308 family)